MRQFSNPRTINLPSFSLLPPIDEVLNAIVLYTSVTCKLHFFLFIFYFQLAAVAGDTSLVDYKTIRLKLKINLLILLSKLSSLFTPTSDAMSRQL
jgi:hypothetical protein